MSDPERRYLYETRWIIGSWEYFFCRFQQVYSTRQNAPRLGEFHHVLCGRVSAPRLLVNHPLQHRFVTKNELPQILYHAQSL